MVHNIQGKIHIYPMDCEPALNHHVSVRCLIVPHQNLKVSDCHKMFKTVQ